jgi:hypothetical protein
MSRTYKDSPEWLRVRRDDLDRRQKLRRLLAARRLDRGQVPYSRVLFHSEPRLGVAA